MCDNSIGISKNKIIIYNNEIRRHGVAKTIHPISPPSSVSNYPFFVIHAGRFETPFRTLESFTSAVVDETTVEVVVVAVEGADVPAAAVVAKLGFTPYGLGVPSGGAHAPYC